MCFSYCFQVDREASHLCRLAHRNVVRFYGICEFGVYDSPTLVMEFAHGGSLNRVISSRPVVTPSTLLDWALQIATGMAYLHVDARLVHRDLKSCNILIREALTKPYVDADLRKCTLLITDFGMACRSSELVSQQSKLGTVAYAAPEVCRQAGFSFKSDVWSFGVVLWELLTLESPFRNMEQPRLLYLIAMYNYTLHIPDTIPELFSQLLTDCWLSTPDARPAFPEIIGRLKCSTCCDFLSMEAEEFSKIQSGWREAILEYHIKEQEAAALTLSSSSATTNSLRESAGTHSDLTTEKQLLRSGWESLDQYWHELIAREYEIGLKEEHYTRMVGTIGHQFTLLAVLAANHLKDSVLIDPTNATKPKPLPARKRPFARMWFRRAGPSNSLPDCPSHKSSHKRHRSKCKNSGRWPGVGATQTSPSSSLSTDRLVETRSSDSLLPTNSTIKRKPGRHRDGAGGGMPHISPPVNMKHVVHVDADWITGHGLSTAPLNFFPCVSHPRTDEYFTDIDNRAPVSPPTRTFSRTSVTDEKEHCGSQFPFHRTEPPGDHVYANLVCPTIDLPWDRTIGKSKFSPYEHNTAYQPEDKFLPTHLLPDCTSPRSPIVQCPQVPAHQPYKPPLSMRLKSIGLIQRCGSSPSNSSNCFALEADVSVPSHWSAMSEGSATDPSVSDLSFDSFCRDRISAVPVAPQRLASAIGPSAVHLNSVLPGGRNPSSFQDTSVSDSDSFDRRRSASGPVFSNDANAPRSSHTVPLTKGADLVHLLCSPNPPTTISVRQSPPVSPCELPTSRGRIAAPNTASCRRPFVESALWSVLRLALSLSQVSFSRPAYPVTTNSSSETSGLSGHSGEGARTVSVNTTPIPNGNPPIPPAHSSRPRLNRPALPPLLSPTKLPTFATHRRIQSVDRFSTADSYVCSRCRNMDVRREPSPASLVAHHAEFGDPHSPFLGMLAGSGRRPTLPDSTRCVPSQLHRSRRQEPCLPTPNRPCCSSRISPSLFSITHSPYCTRSYSPSQCVYHGRAGSNRLVGQYSLDALSSSRQAPCEEINGCNNRKKHSTDIADFHHASSQVDSSNESPLNWLDVSGLRIDTPSSVAACRRLYSPTEHHGTLFLDYRDGVMVDDRCTCYHRLYAEHETGSIPSLSDTSYNPVAHSRDAYLKATQDGYLNGLREQPGLQFPADAESSNSWYTYPEVGSTGNLIRESQDADDQSDLDLALYRSQEEDVTSTNSFPMSFRTGQDEDGQTLVPFDSLDIRNVPHFFSTSTLDHIPSADKSEKLTSYRSMTLPRRPLQRSPAIRTSEKPSFSFLNRNRSASECARLRSYDKQLTNSSHDFSNSPSPCGPFVSAHSTFL